MKSRSWSGSAFGGQRLPAVILFLIIFFSFLNQACSRQEPGPREQFWLQEEITEEPRSEVPPSPKISEEIYVEITARAALIFDKYKEDLDEAHRQMDLVYQKFGVTFDDYDRFRKSLPADKKKLAGKKGTGIHPEDLPGIFLAGRVGLQPDLNSNAGERIRLSENN